MMPRPLETLSCTYIILCLLIVMYITDWLIYLGSLKLQLLIFSAVFYQVSLEGHQTIYMCCSLFVCKGSTSYIESINQSVSLKKNIYWYGTQKLPKILNIYLRNYQTETASYFSSYKTWKSNYGMQLFKFFHTENTSKQQKMMSFVRNCLVKMTLRLF